MGMLQNFVISPYSLNIELAFNQATVMQISSWTDFIKWHFDLSGSSSDTCCGFGDYGGRFPRRQRSAYSRRRQGLHSSTLCWLIFSILKRLNWSRHPINCYVQAVVQKDADTLDRTAGAIRGRSLRVCDVVDTEMELLQPSPYTDKVRQATRVLRRDG